MTEHRAMARGVRWRGGLLAGAALAAAMPGMATAQGGTATVPLPGDAPAQQAETPPVPAASAQAPADTSGAVEDIVVTAQKRSESVQNVPIAITALDNEQLRAAGVSGTADLRVAVPALNVTTATGGYGLPRIRGIGATGQGPGIENPVAVYVDGVYYGAAFGVLQSLYDTAQVAVLKGPQGTLFGRNATGGLIQISTLDPSFDTKGKAEFGYGNFDAVNAAGYVSGGITDTIAVGLSAQYERHDGYGTNLFSGRDIQGGKTWAMRGKVLWKPSDLTSVLLSGDFNGRDASEPAFRNFTLNTLGQNVTQQIVALGGDPERDVYTDVDPVLRARQHGGSLTVSQDLGGVTLKSITAYRKSRLFAYFDPDGTTQPQLRITNDQYDKQLTQEVNLISEGGGPFTWVLGGYYMHDKAGTNPGRTTGTNTFGDNGYTDNINQVTLNSWAGFAEGTWEFLPATRLIGGVRYTNDHRELNAYIVSFNGNTNATTTSAVTAQERTFDKVSWRASIDHRYSDQLLVYASYNRGFRSGTFVPQATPIIVLDPEVVDAYEVGLKSDLFDRRVRVNLATYLYDESNVQVFQVIAGVQNVYNAEGARIYGLDGDLTWRVTNNFRLFGGFNVTHARYTNFTNAIVSVPYPTGSGFTTTAYTYVDPATGQRLANTACLGTFLPATVTTQAGRDAFYRSRTGGNCLLRGDASGNKLQNTPSFTLSLGGSLDVPTSVGRFTLAGNYYYNDGFVGSADERVYQPHYTTVDASLTWRQADDHLFVRVYGKNLTDAFYRTQIGATNSGDNGTYAAPRTYGATIGFDF